MPEESRIAFIGKRTGYGPVTVLFRIFYPDGKIKRFEYDVGFEDVANEIDRIASGFKTKRGEIVPPSPWKALKEAEGRSGGKYRSFLEQKPRPTVQPPVCPDCGVDLEDDFCQLCGKAQLRKANWFDRYKRVGAQ